MGKESRQVAVYAGKQHTILHETDTLDGGDLMSDLKIALKDIFSVAGDTQS